MLVIMFTQILGLAFLGTTNVSCSVKTDPWFGFLR